jgi:hypothetical protein
MPLRFYAISFYILCFMFFYLLHITYHARSIIYAPTRLHVAYIPFNSAQFPYHSNNRVTAPSHLHAASQPHVKTQARLFHRPDREPTWASFNIRSPRLPLYLPYIYIYCIYILHPGRTDASSSSLPHAPDRMLQFSNQTSSCI